MPCEHLKSDVFTSLQLNDMQIETYYFLFQLAQHLMLNLPIFLFHHLTWFLIWPLFHNHLDNIEKLQNLICAMGQTFHDILVSDRSERKVFSIALSNAPDDEIKRVLKTGVRLGYLHEATIGNKAGNGRTWLYILNRRLAPSFVLDPTGFQGYLFMTNDDLHRAMTTGRQLRVIDDRLDGDVEQLSLFDIWED